MIVKYRVGHINLGIRTGIETRLCFFFPVVEVCDKIMECKVCLSFSYSCKGQGQKQVFGINLVQIWYLRVRERWTGFAGTLQAMDSISN